MGLVCKIIGHKWHKLPDGEDGCSCSRCGERNYSGRHAWGPVHPISDDKMRRLVRIKHQCTCAWCGNSFEDRHCFELGEGCTIRCVECGYEMPWHDFANGACVNCGEKESAFYRRLILSGKVRLSDCEEAPCKDVWLSGNFHPMRYADYLQEVADLLEVVMCYETWGSKDSKGDELYVYLKERDALEACVRKLGKLAECGKDEARDANNALYQIALSGPEVVRSIAWSEIKDPVLASDPALAGISERWKNEVRKSIENSEAEKRFLERDSV